MFENFHNKKVFLKCNKRCLVLGKVLRTELYFGCRNDCVMGNWGSDPGRVTEDTSWCKAIQCSQKISKQIEKIVTDLHFKR